MPLKKVSRCEYSTPLDVRLVDDCGKPTHNVLIRLPKKKIILKICKRKKMEARGEQVKDKDEIRKKGGKIELVRNQKENKASHTCGFVKQQSVLKQKKIKFIGGE